MVFEYKQKKFVSLGPCENTFIPGHFVDGNIRDRVYKRKNKRFFRNQCI